MLELKEITENKNYNGLSSGEAEGLLKIHGYNTRPAGKHKTWVKRLWDIMAEPMILLLISAAAVYFVIGDKVEASILLCSIIPVILMEFFQESKTDEAVRALDKMMVQYCEVFRDGELKKMDIKFLASGDLVYVTAGDVIPADCLVLNSPGLSVDESMLTGESVPVIKPALTSHRELKEENHVWQGTMAMQGEGYLLVMETGVKTKYGKLGSLLEKITTEKTPLQKKIYHLVRMVAIFAVVFALVVGFFIFLKEGIMAGLLGGITMAMSLIPEEFPIVFSVFLIMGVWRMSKQNALVREMAMVETAGSATVICTDKTGTLTEGKMELKQVFFNGEAFDIHDGEHKKLMAPLIEAALLSLEQIAIDPIEMEVQRYAKEIGIDVADFFKRHHLVDDMPFSAKSKMVHHLWKNHGDVHIQYTAGAPEFVIERSALSDEKKREALSVYEKMADAGYRVIGIAKRAGHESKKIFVNDLEFVGLLAMSDPPRAGVKEAIIACQKAGIRVIMITGDNRLTAHNVAEQIGLNHNEEIMTGADLSKMSPTAMQEAVKRYDIFTRVEPEQKYALVEALKARGEIVAMTGDGVNDAPALKRADIGIAMGQKGTEVARSAAGIVLMDDNFSSIVNAVREGRRIYDNLRHAFVFLFSFHLPIVGLAVLPFFFGQSLVFMPIHIIFLELICDPVSVIGFEKEKARHNLMQTAPRPFNEPLISPKSWVSILVSGMAILAVSFGFYYYFTIMNNQVDLGRSLAFGSLIAAQAFLILMMREWQQVKSNLLLLLIPFFTLIALFAIFVFAPLRGVFHLSPLTSYQATLMFLVPLATIGILAVGRKVVGRVAN